MSDPIEQQEPDQEPHGELVPFPSAPAVPAADTSYEIALDQDPAPAAELVHGGDGIPLPARPGERRPVIPGRLRTWTGVRATAARHGGLMAHRSAYHAARSPGYVLLVSVWAVVGLFVTLGRMIRWWWLAEQSGLRSQAVISGDAKEWRSLHQDAQDTRRSRGIALLAAAAGVALGIILLRDYAPWWGWALLIAAVVPLLARAGRPAGKPIIKPATTTPRFRVLNADIVLRAYYAAGLGNPDKAGQQVTFGSPMARDGDGSRVLVDLPFGKGLDDAVKARPAIASGLDVSLSQVFIHRDPTSHRRHTLWVADRDPLAVPVGRTPLLAGKATDIWKPAPLGLDERGQLVTVPLMWNSILISALPRAGKTFSARLLALYAALDPYVKLSVFDAKGSPDWRKFALVADRYAFGLTPTRDGLPVEILMETLTEIRSDVENRYHRLSEMPVSICPEGKLTREIARDPRYEMPVRVIVLEEFQEYFDVGKASADIASMLVFLVKVAPGAGIILIDATQRPSGVGGGGQVGQQFTSFRDNHALRFGLRTSSWQVSELCLGAGAYSEGAWTRRCCCPDTAASASCGAPRMPRRPSARTWPTGRTPRRSSPQPASSGSTPGLCPGWRPGSTCRRTTATSWPTCCRCSAPIPGCTGRCSPPGSTLRSRPAGPRPHPRRSRPNAGPAACPASR
jgi:DNA segregation ATPase FtsK/SpoIIIE, S-DNA-T family